MVETTNVDEIKAVYIYESPDKGLTIYRRKFMAPHITRELITNTEK